MTSFRSNRMGAAARPTGKRGFTLVEILVSLAVLTILLLVSAQVIGVVQRTWTSAASRVSQFREARTAFDILTRNLSQATLNTYMDYDNNYLKTASASTSAPTQYQRYSDLQFVCGKATDLVQGAGAATESELPGHAIFFQAPLGVVHSPAYAGLDHLLCGRGYFVQFSSDLHFKPSFLPPSQERFRYRLMEFSPPAEQNLIYAVAAKQWFATSAGVPLSGIENPLTVGFTRPVADNILTLIISPQVEKTPDATKPVTWIADDYTYDSTLLVKASSSNPQGTQHLLPPLVRIILVALDERSAERLAEVSGNDPPLEGSVLSKFQNPLNLDKPDGELKTLEEELQKKRLNYRVFSATIQLRASKWSI